MIQSFVSSSQSLRYGVKQKFLHPSCKSAAASSSLPSFQFQCRNLSHRALLISSTSTVEEPNHLRQQQRYRKHYNHKWNDYGEYHNNDKKKKNGSYFGWIFWASILSVTASSSPWVVKCDHDDDDDDDVVVEEDPYENLPEEDEPTHCSICLTYRQGPCRPYWRKVEACTKDNELKKEDDGEGENKIKDESDPEQENKQEEEGEEEEKKELPQSPCFKYMLPWIECATGFKNLYSLIELDTNYTLGIADLEKEATLHFCWARSAEPKVDWSQWQLYVSKHKKWKPPPPPSRIATSSPNNHIWKTLDQSKDPELVQVEAIVPMREGQGVLECAYAIDQAGNVIGFVYGKKPSEAEEIIRYRTENGNSNFPEETVSLSIRILPSHTRTVTIAAAYTQPKDETRKKKRTASNSDDDDESDGEPDAGDSHIYKSRPFLLQKVARK